MPSLRRRTLLSLAAGGAAASGLAAPALAQSVRLLRFGSMEPTDTIYHRACVMFGDELAKISSGKMKVQVYPNSQLGGIAQMMSAVQVGSLSMSLAVPAWYSTFLKPLDTFTLPYLVSSIDRLKPALDGEVGQRIAKLGETAGFKVVGYWLMGGRHIVNRLRPVNSPADVAGMKIRVINSQVYIQTFRALGANAVAMDPSELYLALQQGVIDGFEYPLGDILSYKLDEVAKYVSLDNHTTDFFIVSMSKTVWDGLHPEEQAMVSQAMANAMDWQWKTQPGEIAQALTTLRQKIHVNDITPANKELFIKATRPVYAQFQNSIGKDFLDLAMKQLGSA